MGQRSNGAAVKDAQIKSSREDCALSMGQRSNNATAMDAQINLSKVEYVGDTEQTETPTITLQLLQHALGQNLTKLL